MPIIASVVGSVATGLIGSAMRDSGSGRSEAAANRAAELSDPFKDQRRYYQSELNRLYQNPNSFSRDQTYKYLRDQALEATQRAYGPKGMNQSGNQYLALLKEGGNQASAYLNDRLNFLAQLAGAGANPGAAGAAYGNTMAAGLPSFNAWTQNMAQSGGMLAKGLYDWISPKWSSPSSGAGAGGGAGSTGFTSQILG